MKLRKQVYIFSRELGDDGVYHIKRHNLGFNFHELLGLLEETQLDLIQRARDKIAPDVVTRQVTEFVEKEVK